MCVHAERPYKQPCEADQTQSKIDKETNRQREKQTGINLKSTYRQKERKNRELEKRVGTKKSIGIIQFRQIKNIFYKIHGNFGM